MHTSTVDSIKILYIKTGPAKFYALICYALTASGVDCIYQLNYQYIQMYEM